MDEPLGALDAQTRAILQGELIRLWEASRKTACAANMKQLGNALIMYTGDYNNRFPDTDPLYWYKCNPSDTLTGRSRSWQNVIYPYIKDPSMTIYICPDAREMRPAQIPADANNDATDRTGYAYNGAYWRGARTPCGWTAGKPDNATGMDGYIKTSRVQDSAGTFMVLDSSPNGRYQVGDPGGSGATGAEQPSTLGPNQQCDLSRHNQGANALYTDNHVKWISTSGLYEKSTIQVQTLDGTSTGDLIERHWTIEED